MDPKYEAEILRAFAIFVEKGLVYQSMKPVFWSTGAQTALAEAEVEYQERDDTAVFVKFPIISGALKDKASIAIWTTTPWTLPANLLIAVHPKEIYVVQEFTSPKVGGTSASRTETLVLAEKLVPQFSAATGFEPTGEPMQSFPGDKLEGIGAQHPFLPRTVVVLTAEFVTMDTGTGAVHIAGTISGAPRMAHGNHEPAKGNSFAAAPAGYGCEFITASTAAPYRSSFACPTPFTRSSASGVAGRSRAISTRVRSAKIT